MKKFHEFYTPEKLQQLLNDYDMLLNKNCVSKTIDKIRKMPSLQLVEISKNAYETAKKMTDENAAQMYIDEIRKNL